VARRFLTPLTRWSNAHPAMSRECDARREAAGVGSRAAA
jgi:hypothetical protein